MNTPSTTASRFVIWEGGSKTVLAAEDQEGLNDLLRQASLESLQALHGVEAISLQGLTGEMERMLLRHDLGLLAHGYWPAPGNGSDVIPQHILDQSVEVLQLSVRSSNCLLHAGIATVGELIQKRTDDLMAIPNMGRRSVAEIQEQLSTLALEADSAARVDEFVSGSFSLAFFLPFETRS